MQPQDPNSPYSQQPQPQPAYAQPVIPQAPAPVEQAPAQYAAPPQQYAYPPQAGGASSGMLSMVAGSVALLAVAILLGFVFGGSSYWLLLISFFIGVAGAFLGFKSMNDGASVNKMALTGFILSVTVLSLSFSFIVGQAIAEHKLKAAESSAESGSF